MHFFIYRSAASIIRSGNVIPVESDYTPPEGTSIPTGIYIIGEEIPEGKYTNYFNGEVPSRVRTYANPEDATNDFKDPEFKAVLADYNTSAEINLKAGYPNGRDTRSDKRIGTIRKEASKGKR